jgi:protein-disulfide isomerase
MSESDDKSNEEKAEEKAEESEEAAAEEESEEKADESKDADVKKVEAKAETKTEAKAKPAKGEKKTLLGSAKFVLAFIATLGLGYFAGQQIQEWRRPPVELQTGDRYKVALRGDEPQVGPNDALVTIIEYSDFQCPYCARAAEPLKDAVESYDGDARLIFKHYPLPGHGKAAPAAYVSWAAHQQGKFWEMHDRLFESKADIGNLAKWTEELGLDGAVLGEDMESEEAKKQVDADHISGGQVGIGGTPSFVVNGHMYSGTKTKGQWQDIIDAELETAKKVEDDGTPRAEVYAKLMEGAKETRGGGGDGLGGPPGDRPANKRRPGEPDPAKYYNVPVGEGRPQVGPDDALVTIVEFADFHCPYCGKVAATVKKVQSENPDSVRIIFRQRPLNIHKKARHASKAALAAHRQGKFWEMHDVLFSRKVRTVEEFKGFAEELGLDAAQFDQDFEDPTLEEMIKEDEGIANHYGSRGTPAFFVNGRFMSGAQPYSAFDRMVKQELEVAQAKVDSGVAPGDVYETLMNEAETEVKD